MMHHGHQHTPAEKKALELRLRKIEGQVRGLLRMVEKDADCPEVLVQAVSVRKALKSFSELVIHQHMHSCIEKAANSKEGRKKLKEFLLVLERYVD
jgi:DNA-binding FrmR family transcriptional regulator